MTTFLVNCGKVVQAVADAGRHRENSKMVMSPCEYQAASKNPPSAWRRASATAVLQRANLHQPHLRLFHRPWFLCPQRVPPRQLRRALRHPRLLSPPSTLHTSAREPPHADA
jgi:hypothetical protein